MIDNKDLINKRYGVDGLQIIFQQTVKPESILDNGEIWQYFEFYDINNIPILNPNYNNKNIWNLKQYRVFKETNIYYNFFSLLELPDNLGYYKQKLILNPKSQNVIIQVNYIKLSLVLDSTKLNGFTDGTIIK